VLPSRAALPLAGEGRVRVFFFFFFFFLFSV